jgi:hypothetical protein
MQRPPNDFDVLSFQANQGNALAREKLRRLLLPAMLLIVRRTLQTGQARSDLARQIFVEYRRVAAQNPNGEAKIPSALIELIARRLSDHYIDKPWYWAEGVQRNEETVMVRNTTVMA